MTSGPTISDVVDGIRVTRPVRVAGDAMGGDFGAEETVKGAIQALQTQVVELLLVGDKGPLEIELSKYDVKDQPVTVVPSVGKIGDEQLVSRVKKEELYDLSRDPREQNNLLPDAARDIGEMRREVRKFIEKAKVLQADRRGQEVILDESAREQLKALGYINWVYADSCGLKTAFLGNGGRNAATIFSLRYSSSR